MAVPVFQATLQVQPSSVGVVVLVQVVLLETAALVVLAVVVMLAAVTVAVQARPVMVL
jgi:hypothetical protein